jgi:sec-independent protein translocase protein TatB
MCGISGFELVVILAAAIIFLGPERLPDMMRTVGKVARELRKLRGDLGQVTREITQSTGVDDLKEQLKESLEVDRVRERVKGAESEIDLIRARLKRQVEIPTKDGSVDQPHEGGLPQVKPAAGTISSDESLETPDAGPHDTPAAPPRPTVSSPMARPGNNARVGMALAALGELNIRRSKPSNAASPPSRPRGSSRLSFDVIGKATLSTGRPASGKPAHPPTQRFTERTLELAERLQHLLDHDGDVTDL